MLLPGPPAVSVVRPAQRPVVRSEPRSPGSGVAVQVAPRSVEVYIAVSSKQLEQTAQYVCPSSQPALVLAKLQVSTPGMPKPASRACRPGSTLTYAYVAP